MSKNILSEYLHKLGQLKPDAFVIQIGANDGISFDDTRGFLDMYKWPALLVEPIPEIFEELKFNFSDRNNYIFEQSAITGFDGPVVMLNVSRDTINKNDLHPGYKGMSALYPLKNGFGSDYERDIHVKENLSQNITVNGITLSTLLSKHNIKEFDVFICDAEGHDWEIFKQIDLEKYRPKIIRLEYMNLNPSEQSEVIAKLKSHNYEYEINSQDIDAIDKSWIDSLDNNQSLDLNQIIEKHGSDKFKSGYSHLYKDIFQPYKDACINYLEIGLGTLDPSLPSSFCGIQSHYDHYQPAGILRVWKEYFSNAKIYGLDIAEDCMISEDRITTFLGDSTDQSFSHSAFQNLSFDIILDDGLHTSDAQLKTFNNFFSKVNNNGLYIIEDIGGGGDGQNFWADHYNSISETINQHEFFFGGNILIVRKNYSSKGPLVWHDFTSHIDDSFDIIEKTLSFDNKQIEPTIIHKDQVKQLLIYLNKSLSLDGHVVEFGCFVGESSKYLQKLIDNAQSNKQLFVYDSFEGLPEQGEWEKGTGWIPGSLKVSENILVKNFIQNNLKLPVIHKNWFKNIPPSAIPDKICFAFLDGDFYESIYHSLVKIFDKVVEGGYICFHDFDRPDLPGVRAAAEEFLITRGYSPNLKVVCEQLGVFQKCNQNLIPQHNKDNILPVDFNRKVRSAYFSSKNRDYFGTLPSGYVLELFSKINMSSRLEGSILYIDSIFDSSFEIFNEIKKEVKIDNEINYYNSFDKFLNENSKNEDSHKINCAFLFGYSSELILKSLSNIFNRINEGGFILFENLSNPKLLTLRQSIEVFLDSEGYDSSKLHCFDNRMSSFKKFSGNKKINQIEQKHIIEIPQSSCENLTIVSGLWNINRVNRNWDQYLDHFDKFLKIPCNLFLWVPKSLESFVWERRSKENTFIKLYELEDIKDGMFSSFWNQSQNIRVDEKWQSLASWLPDSPQCKNEYYNPVVMSKMFFLHDAKILNPFNDSYLIWLDAGISQTVYENYFYDNNVLHRLKQYLDPFLFLAYPYEANQEIHGFELNAINKYAGEKIDYVCRGGLFGGHKDFISQAHSEYYHTLSESLNSGLMGTEESIFSIMSKKSENVYNRYMLDQNGLIVKFVEALFNDDCILAAKEKSNKPHIINEIGNIKTNLYFLTFNFPEQLEATIKSLQKHEGFLTKPVQKIIIDNSTNEEARTGNKSIAEKYGFKHISMGENKGICGGRQFAAEHFDSSDSDFYLFFEDDMTISDPEEGVCRNGFNKFIPNLYEKIHKIMLREQFDFLKLSYTEVYMDNNLQVSWYNVPQHYRTETWPNYDKLPTTGLDPNCPRTEFKNIEVLDGLSYISGEIYYANWPHITSRAGNKKMFLNTKWTHPYEQTWMSYIFQETRKGNIKPAILLASTVTHDRFKHYKLEERIEG